jgi:hypothetical protein
MKRQLIIVLISTNLVNSAFADVQINRPGLIPPGLLICDELICKILPDDRDTPAQIISYDPQVGVTVIIKKKRYIVPGNDVMVNNSAQVLSKNCKIPLGDYIKNKRNCDAASDINNDK